MKNVLNEIKNYIERCQNCNHFASSRCGFIFKERDDYGGMVGEEDYFMMDNEEREVYLTQLHRRSCYNQFNDIQFYNRIEELLESADCYYPVTTLCYFFSQCHRLKKKLAMYDRHIMDVLGESVNKVINLCIAFVDRESLLNGENIMPYIKDLKMEYSRKEGLFELMPQELAIQMIEDGDYISLTKRIHKGDIDERGKIHFWYHYDTEETKICHTPVTPVIDWPEPRPIENELKIEGQTPTVAEPQEDPKYTNNLDPDLKSYLDALKEGGFVDDNYKWIKGANTNYHAGIASKIIIRHIEGIGYEKLERILGLKYLASAASTCLTQRKNTIINCIQDCFNKHNLYSQYI